MTVVFVLLAAVLAITAIYRIVAWLRAPTIWRFATVVAFTSMSLAWVMMLASQTVDAWVGVPHLARLVGYLAGICAAGAATIYLLGLRTVDTSRTAVIINAVIMVALLAIMIISWLHADGHDIEPAPGQALSWPVAIFNTTFLYLSYACVLGVLISIDIVQRSQAASHRVGSTAAAIGFGFGMITMTSVVIRFYAGYLAPALVGSLNVIFLVTAPLALVGICGGTFIFIAGVRLSDWTTAARTFVVLTPLWRLAIRRHPEIALPLRQLGYGPAAVLALAARIPVEILDALRQTQVPHRLVEQMGTYDAIVYALQYPTAEGPPASQLVSGDDAQITTALARAYRRGLTVRFRAARGRRRRSGARSP